MKKFTAILLTLAIMLTFTLPAAAYTVNKPELKLVDIRNFIQRNAQFLTDEQKTQLETLKAQFDNWKNLTAAERAQLFADMEALVASIRESVQTKKGDFAAFRLKIQPLLAEIRANNAELKSVFRTNQQLRAKVRAQLGYMKDNDIALPDGVQEDLDALQALLQQLKDTKGDIRTVLEANKENIRKMNYDAVVTAFNEIIAIQDTRIDTMNAINALLVKINGDLPAVPETTEAPTPTP